ncbi:MAG TPA: CBS domain-containing protein [Acidimicrobiales bacterium]|nr:CBS domain-containing protein [Acidimicrobiales bacterium]
MADTTPTGRRVGDLQLRETLVLPPDTTLAETARAFRRWDTSSAVVGVPDVPVAIVTERDLTRALAEDRSPDEAVVAVATQGPLTIDRSTELLDAAELMLRAELRHLVVAEGNRVVGVVSMRDVLAALATSVTAETVVVRLSGLALERSAVWPR